MPDSPLTPEQARQVWQQMHQEQLLLAALRKATEDAGWEMPEDTRRQLMELRRQIHLLGMPWELIDAIPGLEPPDDAIRGDRTQQADSR